MVKKLIERYSWLTKVYGETSGYVHLSEKHFFNTIESEKNSELFSITISDDDSIITSEIRIEAADAMIAITNIILWLLDS